MAELQSKQGDAEMEKKLKKKVLHCFNSTVPDSMYM